MLAALIVLLLGATATYLLFKDIQQQQSTVTIFWAATPQLLWGQRERGEEGLVNIAEFLRQ